MAPEYAKLYKGTGTRAGTRQRPKKNAQAAARATAAIAAVADETPAPPAVDAAQFMLKPLAEAATRRRHAGEPKLPNAVQHNIVLHAPGGKFVQKRHLPNATTPGLSATAALFGTPAADPYATLLPLEGQFQNGVFHFGSSMSPEPESRHRRRRQKQYLNWHDLLSEEFMRLYLDQKHGAAAQLQPIECSCRRRKLTVLLADWDGACRPLLLCTANE